MLCSDEFLKLFRNIFCSVYFHGCLKPRSNRNIRPIAVFFLQPLITFDRISICPFPNKIFIDIKISTNKEICCYIEFWFQIICGQDFVFWKFINTLIISYNKLLISGNTCRCSRIEFSPSFIGSLLLIFPHFDLQSFNPWVMVENSIKILSFRYNLGG